MLSKCKNCKTYNNIVNSNIFIKTYNNNTFNIKINDNPDNNLYFITDEPFFIDYNHKNTIQYLKYNFYGYNLYFISLVNCIISKNYLAKDINYCYFNNKSTEEAREEFLKTINGKYIFAFGKQIINFLGIFKPIYYNIYEVQDKKVIPVPIWRLFKLNIDENINKIKCLLNRSVNPEIDIKLVNSEEDIKDLLESKNLILDIETNSLNQFSEDFKIESIAVQRLEDDNKVYLFNNSSLSLFKIVFDKIIDNKINIIGYNTKFDIIGLLRYFKYDNNILDKIKYEDILFLIYIKDENRFLSASGKTLKDMVAGELNYQLYDNPLEEFLKTKNQIEKIKEDLLKYNNIIPNKTQQKRIQKLIMQKDKLEQDLIGLQKRMLIYNCSDVYYSRLLYLKLINENYNKRYYNFLLSLDKFLTKISLEGFKIDLNRFKEIESEIDSEITKVLEQLNKYAKINWSSGKELSSYLKTLKDLKSIKYLISGQIATGEKDIEKLKLYNPQYKDLFDNLILYRNLFKEKTSYLESYLDKIDNNNFIHSNFNLTGTVTGRISSSSPNFQQIPKEGKVKKIFCSRYENGYILECDYSQMEMRVMAMMSGDKNLLEIFRKDKDIYVETASKIFKKSPKDITKEERNKIKTLVLGLQYGITSFGVSKQLQISIDEAEKLINEYFKIYPRIKEYNQEVYNSVLNNGYAEYSVGRRRHFPEVNNPYIKLFKGQYMRIYRESINAPVQGTASDLCLIKAITFYKKFLINKQTKIVNIIHDSIIFDVHPDEKVYIEKCLPFLEIVPTLKQFKEIIPLKVSIKWYNKYWLC